MTSCREGGEGSLKELLLEGSGGVGGREGAWPGVWDSLQVPAASSAPFLAVPRSPAPTLTFLVKLRSVCLHVLGERCVSGSGQDRDLYFHRTLPQRKVMLLSAHFTPQGTGSLMKVT